MATISALAGTQSGTDCLDSLYDDLVSVNTEVAAVAAGSGVLVSSNDTTVGYLNGKLVAGEGITLTEGTDGGNETLTISTGKNAIINGGMEIAQRGTSFTSTTTPANSDDTFLLDRWILLSDGNDIVDVTQQSAGGVSGNENYVRLDVETAAKKFGICQVIENKNCKGMIGGTASLSFEAKVTNATKLSDIRAAVLAWASTADTVTSDLVATWEAEGTVITPAANWTAENVAANLGVTTSWVKYTISGISIDTASAANIAVLIYQNNVATNDTAGVFLEITNVQLESGSVTTDFEYRQFGDELAKCQRYYCKSYSHGTAPGTSTTVGRCLHLSNGHTSADHTVSTSARFPVSMRAASTITLYDNVGAAGKVSMIAGNGIAGTAADIGTEGFYVSGTNGAASASRLISFQYAAVAEL